MDLVVLVDLVPVSVTRCLGEESLARYLIGDELEHQTETEIGAIIFFLLEFDVLHCF